MPHKIVDVVPTVIILKCLLYKKNIFRNIPIATLTTAKHNLHIYSIIISMLCSVSVSSLCVAFSVYTLQ